MKTKTTVKKNLKEIDTSKLVKKLNVIKDILKTVDDELNITIEQFNKLSKVIL